MVASLPETETAELVVIVLQSGWEERRASALADHALVLAAHEPSSRGGLLFLVGVFYLIFPLSFRLTPFRCFRVSHHCNNTLLNKYERR